MEGDERDILNIDLGLIDEPAHPIRSNVWDDSIDELASSVKQFGLIQPITLRLNGTRYEVIAGHRRLAAFRKLGSATIPAIICQADDVRADAMKVHENLYRLDVNPVDQAHFLAAYMRRANLTPPGLAAQLNRSIVWVETRLDILAYPDYLKQLLYEGKLSLGAAHWLNKIENEKVKEDYCRIAAQQGLSASRAKYWLEQAKLGRAVSVTVTEPPPSGEGGGQRPTVVEVECVFCRNNGDIGGMFFGYFHPPCEHTYLQAVKEAGNEPPPQRSAAPDETAGSA